MWYREIKIKQEIMRTAKCFLWSLISYAKGKLGGKAEGTVYEST